MKTERKREYPCMWCGKPVSVTEEHERNMARSAFVILCDECKLRLAAEDEKQS